MSYSEDLALRCSKIVSAVSPEVREAFIQRIIDTDKIFIYGSGRSGLIGQLFAVRLVQMGFSVHFVGDMTTPIIGKNDLTILVSNTGHTMSVVQTADIAKRIGATVVSVTSTKTTKLAHVSDLTIFLNLGAPMEAAPLGTLFEDSALLFFDSLIPEIMERVGKTEDDMRRNHAIWV